MSYGMVSLGQPSCLCPKLLPTPQPTVEGGNVGEAALMLWEHLLSSEQKTGVTNASLALRAAVEKINSILARPSTHVVARISSFRVFDVYQSGTSKSQLTFGPRIAAGQNHLSSLIFFTLNFHLRLEETNIKRPLL